MEIPEQTGPPKWIDANFIEKSVSNEFTVKSLKIENAVIAGENFATVVYRVLVDSSEGLVSLILKCMPESEFRAKFLREGKFMDREVRMFQTTLPLLRGSLLKPNSPDCYHVMQDGIRDTIVLKDMRPLGYRTRQRQIGLDAAHCRLALTELAHLHGLSIALRIQQPEVFKSEIRDFYFEPMYGLENREKNALFLKTSMATIAKAIENNLAFRFYPLSQIIMAMKDDIFDEMRKAIILPDNDSELEDKILVLNHGDCWSNNLLFKYEEGSDEPTNCCLLDFQLSRCGPPVHDLMYLLFTSTTQATRRKHMDELLQFYLDETNRVICKRGILDPGTNFYKDIKELKKDMKRNQLFGFVLSCIAMPVVFATSEHTMNPDEIMTEENFNSETISVFGHMYSGNLFCERMSQLLEDFDDMGFFTDYSTIYMKE